MPETPSGPTILIAGASRGLGHAMAAGFVKKGWQVIGTVRESSSRTLLHDLADEHEGRVEIETLDICEPAQIEALGRRLSGRIIDILFVNAGTTNRDPTQTIGQVSTEEFMHVMHTNALAPMRVVENLEPHVATDGIIGVMSSGQGSIGNNEKGGRELYRGSKAALNMFMRSFAVRHADSERAMVVMAPGWIRTELGGTEAPFGIDDNIPPLINTLLSKRGTPGLQYVDYLDRAVSW